MSFRSLFNSLLDPNAGAGETFAECADSIAPLRFLCEALDPRDSIRSRFRRLSPPARQKLLDFFHACVLIIGQPQRVVPLGSSVKTAGRALIEYNDFSFSDHFVRFAELLTTYNLIDDTGFDDDPPEFIVCNSVSVSKKGEYASFVTFTPRDIYDLYSIWYLAEKPNK